MNINEIKNLIQDVLQSDISEFELEHMGTRIRLRRGLQRDDVPASPDPPQRVPFGGTPQVSAETPLPASDNAAKEEEDTLHLAGADSQVGLASRITPSPSVNWTRLFASV